MADKTYSWRDVFEDEFFAHECTISDENFPKNEKNLAQAELVLEKIALCNEEIETLPEQIQLSGRYPVIVSLNLNKLVTLIKSNQIERLDSFPWIKKYTEDDQLHDKLSRTYEATFFQFKASTKQGPKEKNLVQRIAKSRLDDAKESKEVLDKVDEAMKRSQAAEAAAGDIVKKVDSLMPNLLTTLGIFVAIIIAVVAVYLSAILVQNGIGEGITVFHTVVTCVLMGHLLFNFIFFFVYLISRMTKHSLACYCSCGKCRNCSKCPKEEKCRWRNKLWFRYPYVVVFNMLCLTAYFSLGVWRIVSVYIGKEIDDFFKGNIGMTLGLSFVLIVVLGVLLWLASCFFSRQKKETQENEQGGTGGDTPRESRAKQETEVPAR